MSKAQVSVCVRVRPLLDGEHEFCAGVGVAPRCVSVARGRGDVASVAVAVPPHADQQAMAAAAADEAMRMQEGAASGDDREDSDMKEEDALVDARELCVEEAQQPPADCEERAAGETAGEQEVPEPRTPASAASSSLLEPMTPVTPHTPAGGWNARGLATPATPHTPATPCVLFAGDAGLRGDASPDAGECDTPMQPARRHVRGNRRARAEPAPAPPLVPAGSKQFHFERVLDEEERVGALHPAVAAPLSAALDGTSAAVLLAGGLGTGKTFTAFGGLDARGEYHTGLVHHVAERCWDAGRFLSAAVRVCRRDAVFECGAPAAAADRDPGQQPAAASSALRDLGRPSAEHGAMPLASVPDIEQLAERCAAAWEDPAGHHRVLSLFVREAPGNEASGDGGVLHLVELVSGEELTGTVRRDAELARCAIGDVLAALTSGAGGDARVPFRNHGVTRALGPALLRALVVVHVSPSARRFRDTLAVLRYAKRVRGKRSGSVAGGPVGTTAHDRNTHTQMQLLREQASAAAVVARKEREQREEVERRSAQTAERLETATERGKKLAVRIKDAERALKRSNDERLSLRKAKAELEEELEALRERVAEAEERAAAGDGKAQQLRTEHKEAAAELRSAYKRIKELEAEAEAMHAVAADHEAAAQGHAAEVAALEASLRQAKKSAKEAALAAAPTGADEEVAGLRQALEERDEELRESRALAKELKKEAREAERRCKKLEVELECAAGDKSAEDGEAAAEIAHLSALVERLQAKVRSQSEKNKVLRRELAEAQARGAFAADMVECAAEQHEAEEAEEKAPAKKVKASKPAKEAKSKAGRADVAEGAVDNAETECGTDADVRAGQTATVGKSKAVKPKGAKVAKAKAKENEPKNEESAAPDVVASKPKKPAAAKKAQKASASAAAGKAARKPAAKAAGAKAASEGDISAGARGAAARVPASSSLSSLLEPAMSATSVAHADGKAEKKKRKLLRPGGDQGLCLLSPVASNEGRSGAGGTAQPKLSAKGDAKAPKKYDTFQDLFKMSFSSKAQ